MSKGDQMFGKDVMEIRNISYHTQNLYWKWGRTISGGNKVQVYRSISKELSAIWVMELHYESDVILY